MQNIKVPALVFLALVAWSAAKYRMVTRSRSCDSLMFKYAEYMIAFVVGFCLLARGQAVFSSSLSSRGPGLLGLGGVAEFLGGIHNAGAGILPTLRAAGGFDRPNQGVGLL